MRKKIFLTLIIALFVLTGCTACSPSLSVKTDRLDLAVGEYVDLCDYVVGDFKVSKNGTSVSLMCETVLHAREPGTSTVTVFGAIQSYDITVVVAESVIKPIVTCIGSPYSHKKGDVLEFTASNSDSDTVWEVNGATMGAGKNFLLAMEDYGEYIVTASTSTGSGSMTAVCFEDIEPTLSSVQTQSGVVVSVNDIEYAQVAWTIDGQTMPVGSSKSITIEEAGRHTVYAAVNGRKTQTLEVVVGGVAQPRNVRYDFDSDYPNVFLLWDGPDAEYEVTIDGRSYSCSGNKFDITEFSDLKQSKKISIQGKQSEYFSASSPVTIDSPVVSEQALGFLDRNYPGGNYYMTSDAEIYDIVAYAMIFRPNLTGQKSDFSIYMGYDSSMSAALLLSKAWARTEQTGSYSLSARGDAKKDNVLNFSITFYSVGEPENFDMTGKEVYENLLTPSFKGGIADLPIDEHASGGQVVTSDQLYYVVKCGLKPEPIEGSAADRIYKKARETLGLIISPEMDDAEVVRAVFDWIMWNTVYDYDVVTLSSVSESVKQPAYYLEGVFDTGFAVCDGIAKSMCLMCNMMDIPCVRVVGTVNRNGVVRHAWNKVFIEGEWYNVDATWSDSKITVGGTTYEGGMHNYFLKADCEMPSHVPFDGSMYASATAIRDALSVCDTSEEELVSAIDRALKDVSFIVSIGDDVVTRDFYCIELNLSVKAREYYNANNAKVNDALLLTLPMGTVSWGIAGNTLLIKFDTRNRI